MSITIKDIAKDTNLSLATISKHLNGKKISAENQLIIEESIKKLGYTPNKTAQLLRARKSNAICIFAPSVGDYYWSSIFQHVEEYFRSYGYSTIIISYDSYTGDDQNAIHLLMSNRVAGVVLIPYMQKNSSIHRLLHAENIPFVCLDQLLSDIEVDTVTSTNFQSAYDAAKYLIQHGHRKLGALSGEPASYTSKERLRGFCKACEDYGIPTHDQVHITDIRTNPMHADEYYQLLSKPNAPTGVLSFGYDITISFLSALNDTPFTIPEDISLISFDDDLIFTAYYTPITVIAQNHEALTYNASALLHQRIKGDVTTPPRYIYVPTQMIERQSVRPYADTKDIS